MDTIVYYAQTREEALKSVTVLCNYIKAREDANHQLFFSQRLMGEYMIGRGAEIDGKKQFVSNRELIIFPAYRTEDFERLKRVKNVVGLNNCMCIVGEGYKVEQKLKDISAK